MRKCDGALRLPDIAAGESETVEIAGLNPEAAPGEEAFLTVYFETAIDLGWAPKGFPVGWQQVALPTRRVPSLRCAASESGLKADIRLSVQR